MAQNKQVYEIDIQANITDAKKSLDTLSASITEMAKQGSNTLTNKMQSSIIRLKSSLEELDDIGFDGPVTEAEVKTGKKRVSEITSTVKVLERQIAGFKAMTDSDKIKLLPDDTAEILKTAETKLKKIAEAQATLAKTGSVEHLKDLQSNLGFSPKEAKAAIERQEEILVEITPDISPEKYAEISAEFDELERRLKIPYDADRERQIGEALKSAEKTTEQMKTAVNDLSDSYIKLGGDANELSKIDLTSPEGIEQLKQKIEGLKTQAIDELNQSYGQLETEVKGVKQQTEGMAEKLDIGSETINNAKQFNNELESMREGFLGIFSLQNGFDLLKRAISEAFESIKSLDAAMTETAVVTDFSIDDMWGSLPQYSKMATNLGTTTLGAYETMTLLYQQGLDTNEVMESGTNIMKMARIANLDYAEATDMMTAAIRGFGMEMNETNTLMVNDVYSKLAAITASDTEEIATAMTKTASIANSANMEFQTTAAFLSQIIETTRESAETAGTAMKTVIARFQELKKDPSEIGEVDGEVVDANAIEGALRSVGVALRDSTGQFRDLDDVFLELSSKWNTLDMNTQRYVATLAAGSRLNVNPLPLAA